VHCVSGIQELASLGIRFIATSQGLDTDVIRIASSYVPIGQFSLACCLRRSAFDTLN
jgi:hypothetical protein